MRCKKTVLVVGVALAIPQAAFLEVALLRDAHLPVVERVVPVLPEGDGVGGLLGATAGAGAAFGSTFTSSALGTEFDVLAVGRVDHPVVELGHLLQLPSAV
jgi:hypothetical protein